MVYFGFFYTKLKVVICNDLQNNSIAVFNKKLSDREGHPIFLNKKFSLPVLLHKLCEADNRAADHSFDDLIVYEILLYSFFYMSEHFFG